MGYTIELGYPTQEGPIEIARVAPFSGGSIIAVAQGNTGPDGLIVTATSSFDTDPFCDPSAFSLTAVVDEVGRMDATIDVTANYTNRIVGIIGTHLRSIRSLSGASAAPTFIQLIGGLEPEEPDFDNYYSPTDGNISFLAQTLLGWTLQHPDAVFDAF